MPGGGAGRNRSRSSLQPPSSRELSRLPLIGAAHAVLHRDAKRRVFACDLDRFDFDQVAEPLLQRALNEELRGGGQLITVGREDELHQSAAEVGAVDPLAGRGEEHLLDQIANVGVVASRSRAPAPVEMVWIVKLSHISHIPVTRGCVTTITRGVPVGAQIAWLLCTTSGCPFESTRV